MTPKNLLFHVYACPKRDYAAWRRGIAHVLARLDLFDGRKVAAIAYDETGTREQVREILAPHFDTILSVPNVPHLWELPTFSPLMHAIRWEPGCTFYCHAKGVTHPPGSVAHRWTDVMFHLSLDYPERIDEALATHPVAGAFRRVEWRMEVPWHYAGTFFWFRNADVFTRRDWLPMSEPLNRNDVERWPGRMFEPGADLGLDNCRNLYDEINWRSWITRRFQLEILWDAKRREQRVARSGVPQTDFGPLNAVYDEWRCVV